MTSSDPDRRPGHRADGPPETRRQARRDTRREERRAGRRDGRDGAGAGPSRRTLLLGAVAGGGLMVGGGAAVTAACGATVVKPLVQRCRFGAWAGGSTDLVANHRRLETELGVRLPVFSYFKDWSGGWDTALAARVAALDPTMPYDLMIGWEAWGVSLADIADGARDTFLKSFFTGAKTYPGRVILRLFHEMNGTWYPWAVTGHPSRVSSTAQWQAAWRRTVSVARAVGCPRVSFMFCANSNDVGGVAMERYWPGSDSVDVVGVDSYNWDWTAGNRPVLTPDQVIGPMYARLTKLHATAPVMVGELGCAAGAGKADWYQQLYASTNYPRLTQVCFFDQDKERNWCLNSDPTSLSVNRRYLAQAPTAPVAI